MAETQEHPMESRESSIAGDLLDLYDEVKQFNDCCSFLCDAFCALAAEEDALDTSTVEGLKCLSYWMKQRILRVTQRLREIKQKACFA